MYMTGMNSKKNDFLVGRLFGFDIKGFIQAQQKCIQA